MLIIAGDSACYANWTCLKHIFRLSSCILAGSWSSVIRCHHHVLYRFILFFCVPNGPMNVLPMFHPRMRMKAGCCNSLRIRSLQLDFDMYHCNRYAGSIVIHHFNPFQLLEILAYSAKIARAAWHHSRCLCTARRAFATGSRHERSQLVRKRILWSLSTSFFEHIGISDQKEIQGDVQFVQIKSFHDPCPTWHPKYILLLKSQVGLIGLPSFLAFSRLPGIFSLPSAQRLGMERVASGWQPSCTAPHVTCAMGPS